jgi:long-chain acyl-CoA synthetase
VASQPRDTPADGPNRRDRERSDLLAGNVADLVASAAARGPAHPALVAPATGDVLTWSDVHGAMLAEGTRLTDQGVRVGDRVLIRLGHEPAFCVALLGALRAGAIAVPMGRQATPREIAAVAADCAPSVAVGGPHDVELPAAVGDIPVLGPPPLAGPVQPGATEFGVAGGEDIAVLGYTSGTTGRPRGVRLSHRALLANRAQIAALRPAAVNPADRVLLQLPLFHLYGLGAGLLQVCWAGATGVLVGDGGPERMLRVMHEERVTVVAGVPSMYQTLLVAPDDALRAGLESVRLCTAGGAPLAPELLHAFQRRTGLDLFEGYGLTEAAPVLTSTLVGGRAKPGSVGRPLPGGARVAGVELRLVDADADDARAGAAGEGRGAVSRPVRDEDPTELDDDLDEDEPHDAGLVSVRGPNLFSGYWPDGAGGPDADGWFRTADVGFIDADGDLHLVDRAVDLVIVNGFNVYPREVERVLTEHPAIAEAAVVGVPDQRTGEAVKAVLVLRAGATLTAGEVRVHCAASLARFKVPSAVEFVDRLPHSATGKITRFALRSGR